MKKGMLICMLALICTIVIASKLLTESFASYSARIEICTENTDIADILLDYTVEKSENGYIVTDGIKKVGALTKAQIEILLKNVDVPYDINDLSHATKVVGQYFPLHLVMLQICTVYVIFACAFGFFKKASLQYVILSKTMYFREILENNGVKIMVWANIWLILAFTVVIMTMCIWNFELYIPAQYLPPKYIVDFPFFVSILKTKEEMPFLTQYGADFLRLNSISVKLLVANVVLMIMGSVIFVKGVNKHGKGKF